LSELIKNVVILIHGEDLKNTDSGNGGSAIGRLFTPTITNKEI